MGGAHRSVVSGKRQSGRRREILEATLRVIDGGGVDAVTHRAVAEAAGVPLASTTYYFDSRDALVHEALELVIDRSCALVRRHAGVEPPITPAALVDRMVELTQAQLDDRSAPLAAQFELMLESGRQPSLRPLAERWNREYMECMTALVAAAGLPDADGSTVILTTVLEGSLLDQLALPQPEFADGVLRPMLTRVVSGLSG